jgi:ParB-like chromosome segregation protein Spo0J
MSKRSISTYPVHPAAELFPMMSEIEFQEMKEDIRLHGQNDDVLIWNGTLLDGRNRLRACTELGIEPGWAELPKSIDPVTWVFSHNYHRRHMTTSQRAMVAEKLATLLRGDVQSQKSDSSIELSQEDAAKKLNVSVASVKRARRVRKKASKKVVAAVEAGTMSLNAAVATTKPSDAAKAARVKAKSEADAAKALKQKERADAKAAKEKSKADAKAAKEKAAADKEAAKAAALTPAGQAKALKNLIQQHIDKAARLVCDLHRLKPNLAKRQIVVKLIQDAGVNLW